jgi:hypothetical protein
VPEGVGFEGYGFLPLAPWRYPFRDLCLYSFGQLQVKDQAEEHRVDCRLDVGNQLRLSVAETDAACWPALTLVLLRWLGLEEEAQRAETALGGISLACSVVATPSDTD